MNRDETSITFTILILAGCAVGVAGAVIALLGIGDATEVSGKAAGIEFSTSSAGLAVCALGFGFAGFLATRLPKGVRVMSGSGTTGLSRRLARHSGLLVGIAAVAALLTLAAIVAANG